MANTQSKTNASNKDARGGYAAGWDCSGMSNVRLAILPGATHYNIYSSPALAAVVVPFLDTPFDGKN